MTAFERAWARVDTAGDCWLWLGPLQGDGYGKVPVRHSCTAVAHRFFYEHLVGPIPDGLQLDHLCRVRICVRPDHLEPVSIRENSLRSDSFAARHARQEGCKRGHPFDEANTYLRRNARGGLSRVCRRCRVLWNQEHRAAKS